MSFISSAVSVGKRFIATTTGTPYCLRFCICASRLQNPSLSASVFSFVRSSFLIPPLYFSARMVATSTIADGANGYYPEPSLFVIDNKPVPNKYMEIFHNDPARLYNDAYYINLGLDERQQSDLAVKKDIQKVTLEINGQTHDYTYDTLENKENADKEWDISVRLADHYYNTSYTRAIYESDYMYKTSIYGDASKYGKSEKDELEVYITYKIMIDNQANSIQAKVNEIADYYDKDLEYIEERSYIEIKEGENI